ncbi:MAG: alcohol dehydrogenase catalytic domain-containing protein [Lentisphaeria bacterium]|nr:alcohol dehydrogenase catalytic domain-containing protein [Lentisphaeria bacterium]
MTVDRMTALLISGTDHCEVVDLPVPVPGENEVRLAITHCTLCRTDAKMLHVGQRDLVLPRVPGHEIVARHERTGSRFAVWPGAACGHCRSCLNGAENLCAKMRILGFHRDGGLAEFLCAKLENLLPVPEELSGTVASLAEPLGAGMNALDQLDLSEGNRLLVAGAGPVGLLLALAARQSGWRVTLSEVSQARIEQTRPFCETLQVPVLAPEALPDEFDAAINATSAPAALEQITSHLTNGGQFCLFSGLPTGTDGGALLNETHYRQLRLTGAYGCTRAQMRRALDLLTECPQEAGLLIGRCIGLEDAPEALRRIWNGMALKHTVCFE